VQAQESYVRCYFHCELHINFWILSLLQLSTMKFFTSSWLVMALGDHDTLLYPFLEAEFKAIQTLNFLAPALSRQATSMSSVFLKICSEILLIGAPDCI